MSEPISIPQHPLKDDTGKSVDFHFSPWGRKKENYDIERTHRHHFYEILFFHKGNGVHDIDFNTHKAVSRSIHFVAPDNVHLLLRDKESSGCSLLFVESYLDMQVLKQLPFNKTQAVLRPDPKLYARIRSIIEDIENEYTEAKEGSKEIVRSLMQVLSQLLIRQFKVEQPDENSNDTRPELLLSFFNLLQKNFDRHLNVKAYADMLNVSDKHLIECCKQYSGKTPLKHIHETLVSEAKKLLYHSKLSVKEIAYKLNFEDPANFSRFFKSQTGYSPLEYREGIK